MWIDESVSYCITATILWSRCYCPHFTNEETGFQRGQVMTQGHTASKLQSLDSSKGCWTLVFGLLLDSRLCLTPWRYSVHFPLCLRKSQLWCFEANSVLSTPLVKPCILVIFPKAQARKIHCQLDSSVGITCWPSASAENEHRNYLVFWQMLFSPVATPRFSVVWCRGGWREFW